jgi:hypothetical protein
MGMYLSKRICTEYTTMHLPSLALAGASASPTAVAVLPSLTALAAQQPGLAGPQLGDFVYIGAVLAIGVFGAMQVFASSFPEDDNEFAPPMLSKLPSMLNPFGSDSPKRPPEEVAEELRERIQEAAAAGDIEAAFYLEKELKQLMAESGVRFQADAKSEEQLPDKW